MIVGFLTLLLAFDFRGDDRPTWQFGLVGGVSVLVGLVGSAVAPGSGRGPARRTSSPAALALVVVGGIVALFLGDVVGAIVLGSCVGFAGTAGKLAFDSILQRDAPDANRGRSFAEFETRFQVMLGARRRSSPSRPRHRQLGFVIAFLLAAIALALYAIGRLAWAHRTGERQTAATAAAVEIEERFAEVSGEVKGRIRGGPGPRSAACAGATASPRSRHGAGGRTISTTSRPRPTVRPSPTAAPRTPTSCPGRTGPAPPVPAREVDAAPRPSTTPSTAAPSPPPGAANQVPTRSPTRSPTSTPSRTATAFDDLPDSEPPTRRDPGAF